MSFWLSRLHIGDYLNQLLVEERISYDAAPPNLQMLIYNEFLAQDNGTKYSDVPNKGASDGKKGPIPLPKNKENADATKKGTRA